MTRPSRGNVLLRPRTGRKIVEAAASLEGLEQRTLFSGFTYATAPDAFHLDQFVRAVQPPAGDSLTHFGAVVAALGDIDGDGFTDFAIAAPGSLSEDGRWEGDAGSVHMYSGRNLTLIRSLSDGAAGFGSAMVALGDVNADGVPDLAIGSPSSHPTADAMQDFYGRVGIYSGADGSVLWSRNGTARFDEVGWALAAAGDVDHDGITDLMIGAPGAGGDASAAGAGVAMIVAGVDGASLGTFTGEAAGDRFGHAVDGGVDLPVSTSAPEGDGFFDYIIGAPRNATGGVDGGRTYVISGATNENVDVITGGAGHENGAAVAFIGDSDRVGFLAGYAVGSPGRGDGAGTVLVYNSVGTSQFGIHSEETGARFGSEIRRLAIRSNPYNTPFFTVSAPGAAENRLFLYEGGSTGLQSSLVSAASSLAVLGDIDADGMIDTIAGFTTDVHDAAGGRASTVPFMLALSTTTGGPSVTAASSNGLNYILARSSNVQTPLVGVPPQGYVVINGQIRSYTLMGGMPSNATLDAVNNSGLFFGTNWDFNPTNLQRYFFIYNGVATTLADAITSIEGAAPFALSLIKLNDNGDALFSSDGIAEDGISSDEIHRIYLFRSGVLREVAVGVPIDINNAGQILAHGPVSGTPPILINPDGSSITLTGLFRGVAINDSGVVLGNTDTQPARQLAIWENGVITVLSESVQPPEGGTLRGWIPYDIDNTGRIAARIEWSEPTPGPPPSAYPGYNYLYVPGEGFSRISEITTGDPVSLGYPSHIYSLLDTGAIAVDRAILLPVSGTIAPGASIFDAHSGPTGLFVSAVNQDGDAVILRRDGVRFRADTLAHDTELGSVESVVTYVDSRNGRTYAVARTSNNLLVWFRQQADSSFGEGVVIDRPVSSPIEGNLTTFTSIDGRTHIAGAAADGDVIIYFQRNDTDPDSVLNWETNNLTFDHIVSQGHTAPLFTVDTELTAFTTPWGGMNIAGINTEGQIQTLWWAPGISYWLVNNLSAEAGTPALAGGLTPYVAQWGGLHLAAIDEAGHLQSTWWAPGLAQWTHNDLTAEYGGPLLRAGSLTAYVTEWTGLNIAGIDANTGELSVYWWTPNTGGWITQPIDLGENAPIITGRLESAVLGNNLNIFGTTADGNLVRIFWYPSQVATWIVEDVAMSIG